LQYGQALVDVLRRKGIISREEYLWISDDLYHIKDWDPIRTLHTAYYKFFHSNYTWRSCSVLTSAMITGAQMGEMSELGWLIGWSSRDMWADSLYFLYVVLGSICKTFASFQHILWSSSYACWANFDFLANSVSGFFVVLNAYF
jgi:hypothetical protein